MTSSRALSGVINVSTTLTELKARAGITAAGSDSSLWLAREASRAGDPASSTRHLDSARELKRAYDCTCREHQAAAQATATDSDRAPDGRTDR